MVGPASLRGHQCGCSGPAADHSAGDSIKKRKSVELGKLVFAMPTDRGMRKVPVVIIPGEGADRIEGLSGSTQSQGGYELPKARVSVVPVRDSLSSRSSSPLSDWGSVKARNMPSSAGAGSGGFLIVSVKTLVMTALSPTPLATSHPLPDLSKPSLRMMVSHG